MTWTSRCAPRTRSPRSGPSDRPVASLPVRVAESTLEELAARVTGHLRDEVVGAGPLVARELDLGERAQVGLEFRSCVDARRGLDDGLDLLAPVLVRDAEHRDVADLRVGEEHPLDLARIDVHAPRDDHVDLAVAEEQVAVLVEIADVADGEEAVPAIGGRLGRVALVLEVRLGQRHVHGADLTGGELVPVIVEDTDLAARPGLADRARSLHPLLRGDDCRRPRWP